MYFVFDEFEFDGARLELRRHGAPVKVEPVALRLLAALLEQPGSLVTKDTLIDKVWSGKPMADNAITVSVARLRRALATARDEREFVRTVYGSGYRFARPVVENAIAQTQPQALVTPVAAAPFVGRASLLGELHHAAAEAHHGRGRVCVLMGEAGVGKTSLVRAITDELGRSAVAVAWGFCREVGSTPPLFPWVQLVRELSTSPQHASRYPMLRSVSSLLKDLLRRPRLVVRKKQESPFADAPSPLLLSIARAFLDAAEVSPLILVLEDLHRADAASLEVLSLLVDEIGRSRILVLTTMRGQLTDRALRANTALPYVLGHSNTERLPVKRLVAEDVHAYVAASVADADGKLGRAVFEKSQGNPFFMAELVRQLQGDDELAPCELPLPDAALDIVHQRVAALDADTRALLTAASVLGMCFELSVLQTVTGGDARDLARALDHAIASDLVTAAADSTTAFSFNHALVRAALYDAMPADERRRRHLETALAIERHAQTAHVSVPPSELADHFYGALPDTDLAKTVRYCDEAAIAAGAVYARADAARHLKHALAALVLLKDPPPSLRTALLMRFAIFSRGSDLSVFVGAIQEVARLAREQNDVTTALRASIMWHAHPELSSLPGAGEALEHALAMIPAHQLGQRACALAVLATTPPRAFSRTHTRSSMRAAEDLLRQLPSSSPLHVQVVLLVRLFSNGGPGEESIFASAVDQLNQIWAREPKRAPMVPLFICLNRTMHAQQRGQMAAAKLALASGLAMAREIRHPELRWCFERFEALAAIDAGAAEAGRARLDALHRQAARRPLLGSGLFCAFDRAVVLPELGAQVAIDDELARAIVPDACDTPGLWSLKVRVLTAAGRHEEARAALERVSPAQLAELPPDSQYAGTLGHLARAAIALAARAHAEALYDLMASLDGYFASHVSYFCDGAMPQLRGMLARALGRQAEAFELLQRGLQMNEAAGFVRSAAETRIELARCTLELGGTSAHQTALQLASEALQACQRYQLHRCANRATALLAELTPAPMLRTHAEHSGAP